ncbi:hypothetical protein [Cypionkella psychrotolerans]|uniref:hypothetical protein n=1 Tax=Cypionkella psychrotolerans TaxID=1678131 RepID=UPI0012E0E134|nr:hypothetical protein [Cypionkella psychrotolerans]
MKYLYWALPMATVIAYGVWRYFAAQVYVGGLPPFDLHLYSFEQAQTYLAGLTPAAKAIYLGPLHLADALLMFCLAITLVLPIWRWDWPWFLPAMAYVGFDLLENDKVARLLRGGLCITADVENVTLMTSLKFVALAVAAALALWSLWRMRRVAR